MTKDLEQKEEVTHNEKPRKSDYFELKIPRPVIRDISFSPLVIILLVGLAYLLGMQTARLGYMDKEIARLQSLGNTQGVAGAADQQQPVVGPKVDVDPGKLPILGKKDAKITMIEFSDFQCPFCKRFYDETFQQLKKDYIDTGKVRFAFRHAPLDIHPNAPKAAEASECANDQKKFWEMHNALFEQFDSWVNEAPESLSTKLTTIAQNIGIDEAQFNECLNSGKYQQAVSDDTAVGISVGATGTPTFFINGKTVVGAMPYDTFKTILDQELALVK